MRGFARNRGRDRRYRRPPRASDTPGPSMCAERGNKDNQKDGRLLLRWRNRCPNETSADWGIMPSKGFIRSHLSQP